jgi:hypothetical protein
MTTPSQNNLPPSVQADLNDAKQVFFNEDLVEQVDPGYNRMIEGLDAAVRQFEEEREQVGSYLFNQEEFVDACQHVVADQLSALKKEKIPMMEVAKRFNRWITFCDAVAQLGITCVYSKEAMHKEDYATVFSTLKVNKVFETTFFKPRGIRVELTHKSPEVKAKYPWLAMPCLVVTDEEGKEHLIAITPSPEAQVWWLDVLTGFHASYNWDFTPEDIDDVAVTSLDDPYAPIRPEVEEEGTIDPDFLAEAHRTRFEEFGTPLPSIQPPPPPVQKPSKPSYPPVIKVGFVGAIIAAAAFVFKLFRRKKG